MAEEAIVRIVLDDAGGLSAYRPPPTPSAAPNQQNQPTGGANTGAGSPPTSSTNPLPVKVVSAPPPPPPPAAASGTPEWLKSLVDPTGMFNPHVLLEGLSGSGKSTAARHIAFERMRAGQEVDVLDPHNPATWGGAKQVFQGQSAASDMAKFMMDTLKDRIAQEAAAEAKGGKASFDPITIVLSDFARLARESPQLQNAIKSLLTEGRKFNIAVLAETTELTRAASGIEGITGVLANFAQKARFYSDAATKERTVRIGGAGGEVFPVPPLPEYKERFDPGLIKTDQAAYQPPVGAAAEAARRIEKEKYGEDVEAEYRKQKYSATGGFEPTTPQTRFEQSIPHTTSFKEAEKRYDKLTSDDEEKKRSIFGSLLDAAQAMRGTIGGTLGTVAGAGLDVVAGIRKSRKDKEEGGEGLGAIGTTALAGGAAIVAITALTRSINNMTDKAAEYNPQVAQAKAGADIAQVLGDMRRSQQNSGEMAEFIKAQSEMQQKYEDIKASMLKAILPIMTTIMKAINTILGLVASSDDDSGAHDPTRIIMGEGNNIGGWDVSESTMRAGSI